MTMEYNINNLTADALLLRSLKVATARLTSQLYLIWLRPYFHLTIYLGPWSVLSAVSVLTAQLSMSSLNVYHQFMLFRDSLPKVRFTRSPLAKRIKFKINLCLWLCTTLAPVAVAFVPIVIITLRKNSEFPL